MSDVTLSLDEIIKKKQVQRKGSRPTQSLDEIIKKKKLRTSNFQNGTVEPVKAIAPKKIVTDARNKIIQKKRQNIGDARDQLTKLSKPSDARDRLNKLSKPGDARDRLNRLKKAKLGVAATRIGRQAERNPPGASGLKTQRNIKPTASRPVARAGRSQPLNNRANMNQQEMRAPMRQMQPTNMHQQEMRAPMRQMQPRTQNVRVQRAPYQPQRITPDMVWEKRYPQEPVYHQAPPVTYRDTVDDGWDTPIAYSEPEYDVGDAPITYMDAVDDDEYETEYDDDIDVPITYRDPVYVDELDAPIRKRPVYVEAPRSRPVQIRERPVYVEAPRSRPAPIRERPVYVEAPRSRPAPIRERPVYVEAPRSRPAPVRERPVYVEAPRSRPAPARASNLAARMEQRQPRPQGQGQKVLVTNLHPSVSEEDMEELFNTIGKVINVQMIRKGVAEAVFLKAENALKFVEVFHNRSLDGLRMNVQLARGRTGY